jgi:hypothetical protein
MQFGFLLSHRIRRFSHVEQPEYLRAGREWPSSMIADEAFDEAVDSGVMNLTVQLGGAGASMPPNGFDFGFS